MMLIIGLLACCVHASASFAPLGFSRSSSMAMAPRRMLAEAAQIPPAADSTSWMPHPGSSSQSSSSSNSTADYDRISDWLSSITGPTALISSPSKSQVMLLSSPTQGVLFDGRASSPLVGTQLVSWDWEVAGKTAEGKLFETSFTGESRQVLLPPGTYSVTLTVQAVQLKTGDVTAGSDYVTSFTVRQLQQQQVVGSSSSSYTTGMKQDASEGASSAWQQQQQQQQQQQMPPKPAAFYDLSAAAAATDKQFASWSSSSSSPAPSAQTTVYADPPPYLTDGTGNPFGWAFGSVLAAANSVSKKMQMQQRLQQQEEQRKQQDLERLRLLLFPSPPPPPTPVPFPPPPSPAPPSPPAPPTPPPPSPAPEPQQHEPAEGTVGKNKGGARGKKGVI